MTDMHAWAKHAKTHIQQRLAGNVARQLSHVCACYRMACRDILASRKNVPSGVKMVEGLLTDMACALPTRKKIKLTDAHGLHLTVTAAGGKYWRMGYRILAKRAADQIDNIKTEEATKTSLIMPFLSAWGYW